MMAQRLAWGILATGRIAGSFARGVDRSQLGRLVAVGSRSRENAERFARDFPALCAHASYEALLDDPEVDAVYIATPHPQHVEWAVRAAAAGKHVLCEKPAGLTHTEMVTMAEAARAHSVVFMEAFMYRCHPQTAKIAGMVRDGVLGEIKLIQGSFGFNAPFDPQSRLWSNATAGGGILDVGCYPVSMARLLAGASVGAPFLDPVEVTGAGQLHPETGVDVVAAATLRFSGGLVAQVAASLGVEQDNTLRVYGTEGMLRVPAPYKPSCGEVPARFFLHRQGREEEISIVTPGTLYELEADAFATAVAEGRHEVPAMTVADSLGNMATLDRWRAAIGLVYEQEKSGQRPPTQATVTSGDK
jgi:predicted dehydrogenase